MKLSLTAGLEILRDAVLLPEPVTMIAGAALVSTPIIIHLINRMRFRRVKWAAMEFLLKAQKRMRRKMIIEQLILLFLRCFLVFLLGLLFARFLGFDPLSGKETRPTAHIVILDDTPSMADKGRAEGVETDAFTEAGGRSPIASCPRHSRPPRRSRSASCASPTRSNPERRPRSRQG